MGEQKAPLSKSEGLTSEPTHEIREGFASENSIGAYRSRLCRDKSPRPGKEKALCLLKKEKELLYGTPFFFFAEREGFEPPEPLSSTVFKTAAIDHSAISPCRNALVASNSSCELWRPPFLLLTRAHKALVIFFLDKKKMCAG